MTLDIFFLPTLTVILTLPFFSAVILPALSTVATFFFEDLKVTVAMFDAFFVRLVILI
jgi:hypothetical protein